ncbi:MAG: CbtB domain-containing protein [Marivibrio sp.]|uniref:CbtB domain-containing protein n=1 Tax=Marivibrio sp. TaxID=2039719 RepID=UPI0032EFBB7A
MQTMTAKTGAVARPQTRLAAALFAALFGALLVFGAGLANSSTLHNAAHDARHAFAFPCH